jgi:uncharacterized membrane protein
MSIFAHNMWIEPWEIHPALTHFPIAFLIGGAVVDLVGLWRTSIAIEIAATRLLLAGWVTGLLAGVAGIVAYFTLPAHTEAAHDLMYWHAGLQVGALLLLAWPIFQRCSSSTPSTVGRLLIWSGVLALIVGSGIGGSLVYHGGAGVDPQLLTPAVREHEH